MVRIPDDLATRYGAILDEFEGALKTLNSSKSSTLEDLRSDLRKLGMVGAEISTEIAMLKGAVKLARMTETERQKSEEKDDGVAAYVNILALARVRAHVRDEEHDAETGEVKESTGASQERARTATGLGAGGDHLDPSSRPTATAKTDVPSYQSEASGGGQSQDNSGVRVAPVDTIIEPEAAMLPQTGGRISAPATVTGPVAVESPAINSPDGAFEKVGGFPVPAAPSSRGGTGGQDQVESPISVNVGGKSDVTAGETATLILEPVTIPTAVSLPAEVAVAGDDRSAVLPSAATVVAFRTHNPATHFLNSTGLPRLHGCLKADACGGTHRALCYSCGRNAETASHQGGAA